MAAFWLIARENSWRKSELLGQNTEKTDIARYQAVVMGSWKLIGYMCYA